MLRGQDAVQAEVIAIGHVLGEIHLCPFRGLFKLRHACSLSAKRWILPVAVFGKDGINLISRGYL